MDSRLDSVFKTQFRHTEPLDTRQGIRRHDQPDDRGRKHDNAKDENRPDLWQDETAVSIRALKVFLRQLLDQSSAPAIEEAQYTPPPPEIGDAKHAAAPPRAQKAAAAAKAYQRSYNATHSDGNNTIPHPDAMPQIDLKPEEIRIIHKLIGDLEKLEGANVEFLAIQKSDSFLQSLVDAVGKA